MNIRISCPEGHPLDLAADKLGEEIACPHCLATFRAELDVGPAMHAKARKRDDDDEEEEEERPKKKAPPKAVKKPTKARDDDDDDDDEEDEEDEGEQEAPIEWTRRKLQLNRCGVGMIIMMVAFFALLPMLVFLMLTMDWFVFENGNATSGGPSKVVPYHKDAWWWCGVIVPSFMGLTQTLLMVGLCFNLFVPSRIEGRGMVLGGLIFGGLVYLFAVMILLSQNEIISGDKARAERLTQLLAGAAGLCFVLSVVTTMAYMAKFMVFMKLHLEASQPITNAGFFFLFFTIMFILFVASPYISLYIFWFACFATLIAIDAFAAMAGRAVYAQAMLFLRMKRMIDLYIREE